MKKTKAYDVGNPDTKEETAAHFPDKESKKPWNEPRQIAKIEEEIGEQVMEDKEECTATVSTQGF